MPHFVSVRPDGSLAGGGLHDGSEPPAGAPAFGPERHDVTEAQWAAIGLDFDRWRWTEAGLTERAAMSIGVSRASFRADGVASVVLSGIPAGAVARISGPVTAGPIEIDDGRLELTSTHPGRITVRITLEPTARPWSVTLDATD